MGAVCLVVLCVGVVWLCVDAVCLVTFVGVVWWFGCIVVREGVLFV